jgi:FAD:protein FMN transferase
MACRFELTLPSELADKLDAAQAALDTIDRLEEQLSIFRDSSELSAINRQAAVAPVPAEEGLFDLLSVAAELHRETAGAFDITSTPLSRVWGFLRREGRLPSAEEIAEARAKVGTQHVRLDPQARTVAFDVPGLALNLGSIGKGYALDRAGGQMRADGVPTALLSAGASSLLAVGRGPDGRGFEVGIRDPFDHRRRYGSVVLADQALGVSGIGEQSFEVEGRRYGHIIDPRSGWPVAGRALVAVVARTATLADALATAFFVGGRAVAERYSRQHPDVSVVVIDMPLQDKVSPAVVIGRRADWRLPRAA